MKKRAGILLIMIGVIYSIDPSFQIDQFTTLFYELLHDYWPVCVVVLGIYLLSSKQTKRKTRF